MSNYSKYLQASFPPLQLPVAEALWSIEKDCPGKRRHTGLQERVVLSTHQKIGCFALFMNSTWKQQKIMLVRDCWWSIPRNFKTNFKKSILDDRVSGKRGPKMFLQIILEIKRLQSKILEFKHRSFGKHSFMDMISTIFFWMKTVVHNRVNQDV